MLTMGQFSKVLLAIDTTHSITEGLGLQTKLGWGYGPNHPTPSIYLLLVKIKNDN